jgi:hypothetical protein
MRAMPEFTLSRRIHVAADPARVHDLLDDFRAWPQWSPWEDLDPQVQHTYSGAARGVGARHQWKGNSKAGEGSMEITASDQSKVVCDLRFLKPFKAQNESRFDLEPASGGTDVTWTMTGQRNPLMAALGRLFFDKAIGKDFDKGLAKLKATAEA